MSLNFSWIDAKGEEHSVWYVADDTGFKAFGDIVPPVDHGGTLSPDPKNIPTSIFVRTETPPVSKASSKGSEIKVSPDVSEKCSSCITTSKDDVASHVDNSVNKNMVSSNSQVVSKDNVLTLSSQDSDIFQNTIMHSKMNTQMKAKNMQPNILPQPIPGTNFILVSKMRPPTFPKFKSEQKGINPKPVSVMGNPPEVISGLHTNRKSKQLSISNSQNNLTSTASKQVQEKPRRVPRPSKVEGTLNLDNFFRPVSLAKSSPKLSEDYFYYDYYYYDDPSNITETDRNKRKLEVNNTTSTPTTKTTLLTTTEASLPKSSTTQSSLKLTSSKPIKDESIEVNSNEDFDFHDFSLEDDD